MNIIVSILLTITINLLSLKEGKNTEKLVSEFMDLKFGMFVHWGPVSLKGTEIGWSRGQQVPIEEYDNLYKEFNPVNFNAEEWIKTLKNAGMKYFVITSRHHDGFSLWPSDFSDYDIAETPYKNDILMQLKEACYKYDIIFGTYYSICDWKHPDYPLGSPGGKTQKETGDMNKFVSFVKGQTKELIEKYNTKILWFDGEWEEPWTHEMGLDLYNYLKELDNSVIINNRVDKGRKGMEGVTISKDFAGDFATPEQRIGTFDIENPWESCITICNQWAWKPNDSLKSFEECIQTLLKTVGGGGNLLLNIGPMPGGKIEPRQVERLREMGDWLNKYGESVYDTKGGPYKPTEEFSSTRKGKSIYLHLFNAGTGLLNLPVPGAAMVKKCRIMKGEDLSFTQHNGNLQIEIPQKHKQEAVTTIELILNMNANQIKPITLN